MITDVADFPPAIRALFRVPVEAKVWAALRGRPDVSVRQLGRELGYSEYTIWNALTRLAEVGHLRREPTGPNRRIRYHAIDPSEQRIA